jgi:hypothetical protein
VGIDKAAVLAEVSPAWTEGLDGAELDEARRLLDAVVDDWAVEADPTPDPAAVLRFQQADLAATLSAEPAERLAALRTRVVGRAVDRLSTRTYALGEAILAGSVGDDEAREQGSVLLHEAEALGPSVAALSASPTADAARRDLSDAVMEALYAVERKAMSARLARSTAGGPDVRP